MTSTASPVRPTPAPNTEAATKPVGPPAGKPVVNLPRRWIESVLPAELPQMAREIIRQVRADIPEYRRAMDGPYGRSIRASTEKALLGFMTQFFRTGELSADSEQFFRELGRGEALEGRTYDMLQAAYRTGALTAWRRIVRACEREPLPADIVGPLAESIFGFADRLARLSSEGYAAAQGDDAEVTARMRARLARMIVSQPETPVEAIHEAAVRLGWPIPERLVVLDVRFDDAEPDPAELADLACDAPVEWEQAGRLIVLPAPADCDAIARVASKLPGVRISVGASMQFADAPQSLRWARLATRLRDDGVLPDEQVLVCEENLPTLLVHAEPAITELLVTRRLAPLLALSGARRLKFGRLLSAWLECGGSQAELAEAMSTHRQTLHYRVGRLQAMFGDQLHDPAARVEILLALRAVLPRWESEAAR
jgi:hypothetical protein